MNAIQLANVVKDAWILRIPLNAYVLLGIC